jgi:hypothetical protein
MKGIKVVDQKILNLADRMRQSTSAMEHWTDVAMREKHQFWDAVLAKYGSKLLDPTCLYDYDTQTIRGSHQPKTIVPPEETKKP